MSDSPSRKKLKLSEDKRKHEDENMNEASSSKHRKMDYSDKMTEKNIETVKKKNFMIACKKVSFKAYIDYYSRFQLTYLPICIKGNCVHQDFQHGNNINEMSVQAQNSFNMEFKSNLWCEALEVCQLSISSTSYLPAKVLKDVVEIILNAHEDINFDYSIAYLIDKCQQILALNFSSHPPCMTKEVRMCYVNFLTSSLDKKENTFSNRKHFDYDKGIVKYCMDRLEYEISSESIDGPLVDKDIPEDIKQSVKEIYWKKEKCEIFELLDRNERIKRLMIVLESVIELLQFDIAIWHSRCTDNLSRTSRSQKLLIAEKFWSNNIDSVNEDCKQILRIFACFIHLQYPVACIRIMTLWLNTVVQMFYIYEEYSTVDYPNTSKYCAAFAKEFYNIIAVYPQTTIIRILTHIRPTCMQHMVGTLHLKRILATNEPDFIKISTDFIKRSLWDRFPRDFSAIEMSEISDIVFIEPKKIKKVLKYLTKKCKTAKQPVPPNTMYPKLEELNETGRDIISQNRLIYIFYVTLKAYLEMYNVYQVQETLDKLNESLNTCGSEANNDISSLNLGPYEVSEHFIKKYKSIYQFLKEFSSYVMSNSESLPENFKIFNNLMNINDVILIS